MLSLQYENRPHSMELAEAFAMFVNCRCLGSSNGPTKETASPLELILYWFSHENLERFLSIKPCLFLYTQYIGRSAQLGKAYVEAKNRIALTD